MKRLLKKTLSYLLLISLFFPAIANAALSKKDFQLLEKAATNGDVKSQSKLGDAYNDGDGVNKDCSKSIYWYEQAAQNNSIYSQLALGVMYSKESCYFEFDNSKSTYWFEEAAKKGHSFAQYKTGIAYANGYGVPIDDKKAVYWLSKSENQGNVAAKKVIGISIQSIDTSFDYGCARPFMDEPFTREGLCAHRFSFPLIILNGRKYSSNKSTITIQKLINASIIDFLELSNKSLPLMWDSFSSDITQDYAFAFFSKRWVNQFFGFTVVSKTNEKITLDYAYNGYPGGNYHADYNKRYILNLNNETLYTTEDLITNKAELLKVMESYMNKAIVGTTFKEGYFEGAFNKNKAGIPVLISFPNARRGGFKVEDNNLIVEYHRCSLTYCAAGYPPSLSIPLREVQAYIDLDKL